MYIFPLASISICFHNIYKTWSFTHDIMRGKYSQTWPIEIQHWTFVNFNAVTRHCHSAKTLISISCLVFVKGIIRCFSLSDILDFDFSLQRNMFKSILQLLLVAVVIIKRFWLFSVKINIKKKNTNLAVIRTFSAPREVPDPSLGYLFIFKNCSNGR